jgi:hypothetical protein
MIGAGTYDEGIIVDKAVTILGANQGVSGTGTGPWNRSSTAACTSWPTA